MQNLPQISLIDLTAHLWSVCVEMQFYIWIALLYAVLGTKGLVMIPLGAAIVTCLRIVDGMQFSIVTWYRIDEILAGGTMALVYYGRLGARSKNTLAYLNSSVLLILFLASCHNQGGFLTYARPYLAATLVGSTLFRSQSALEWRWLRYIAEISFALYILHPLLAHSWLGSGDVLERYVKRPLLLGLLLGMAHLSTFQFEHRWMAIGKKLGRPKPATSQ